MGFCHVGQDGLDLLASSDPPTWASHSAGVTGMSHHPGPPPPAPTLLSFGLVSPCLSRLRPSPQHSRWGDAPSDVLLHSSSPQCASIDWFLCLLIPRHLSHKSVLLITAAVLGTATDTSIKFTKPQPCSKHFKYFNPLGWMRWLTPVIPVLWKA